MTLAFYKTDKDAENEGRWFKLAGGGEVKLARLGNKAYAKRREQLEKPYSKLVRAGGSIPDEKQDEILITTFAETIIKDWRGIIDPDVDAEKELPFSVENAKKTLEKYRDFLNEVAALSSEMEAFRAEERKEEAKN